MTVAYGPGSLHCAPFTRYFSGNSEGVMGELSWSEGKRVVMGYVWRGNQTNSNHRLGALRQATHNYRSVARRQVKAPAWSTSILDPEM